MLDLILEFLNLFILKNIFLCDKEKEKLQTVLCGID